MNNDEFMKNVSFKYVVSSLVDSPWSDNDLMIKSQ